MIQDVEELGPELDVEAFRDSCDLIVFRHEVIEIEQPRPNDRITPQVAEEIDTRVGIEGWESRIVIVEVCNESLVAFRVRGIKAGRRDCIDQAIRVDILKVSVAP